MIACLWAVAASLAVVGAGDVSFVALELDPGPIVHAAGVLVELLGTWSGLETIFVAATICLLVTPIARSGSSAPVLARSAASSRLPARDPNDDNFLRRGPPRGALL